MKLYKESHRSQNVGDCVYQGKKFGERHGVSPQFRRP
jgi:hypothetical protein